MSGVADRQEFPEEDLESGHMGNEAAQVQVHDAPLEVHNDTGLVRNELGAAATYKAEGGNDRIIVTWQKDDPENPVNWSKKRKWLITITTCFIAILVSLPAGAYGVGNNQMSQQFSISQTNLPWLYWATASWYIGAGFFPVLFVPLTEQTGRMPGYCLTSMTRFFGGGASSVCGNIVAGTITDVWKDDKERSMPMDIFGMISIVGVALDPFIGGAIQRNMSWRAIYWIQLAFDGGMAIPFLCIVRETRGDVILARRASKMRKEGKDAWARSELQKPSISELLKISFKRPVKMLFTGPVVASFTLWISFAWGMVQLAISAGAIVGTIANPAQDVLYLRSTHRNKECPGQPIPEARLYSAVPGSLLFTAGLFWYGWSLYPDIPWIMPTSGIGCVGLGIFSIYLTVVNYLSDSYETYATSALTAAALGRAIFSAFLPLASQKMYEKLGYQWASSLLGFIGLFLSLSPIYLLWQGPKIRRRSSFIFESTFDDVED